MTKIRLPSLFSVLLIVAAVAFVCGCRQEESSEDFHVSLQDAGGIGVGNAVQWRGLQVGLISTAAIAEGKVRLGARLRPEYRDSIRSGVKAKASRGFLGRGLPVLELYGGSDASMPVLPRGAEIPEAGFTETLSRRQILAFAAVVGLLALLYLVLRGIKRIITIAVAVLFVAFSVWFVTCQWKKHAADLVGPDVEVRVNELAHQMLTSPEAQAAWESLRGDLADALSAARKHGDKAVRAARAELMNMLENESAELERQGQAIAADQILNLKTRAQELLRDQVDAPEPPSCQR